jgi:hypothetical protein
MASMHGYMPSAPPSPPHRAAQCNLFCSCTCLDAQCIRACSPRLRHAGPVLVLCSTMEALDTRTVGTRASQAACEGYLGTLPLRRARHWARCGRERGCERGREHRLQYALRAFADSVTTCMRSCSASVMRSAAARCRCMRCMPCGAGPHALRARHACLQSAACSPSHVPSQGRWRTCAEWWVHKQAQGALPCMFIRAPPGVVCMRGPPARRRCTGQGLQPQ